MCIVPNGVGLAAKVLDGNDRAVSPFVVSFLILSGFLLDRQAARLERHRHPTISNCSH